MDIQGKVINSGTIILGSLLIVSYFALSAFYLPKLPLQENHSVGVKESNKIVSIENSLLKVDYNLSSGTYAILDKRESRPLITDAYAQMNMLKTNEPFFRHSWSENNFRDELGSGKVLTIKSSAKLLLYPDIILHIYIYSDKGYIVFKEGVENKTTYHINLTSFYPMIGKAFGGADFSDFMILDGNAGGAETKVRTDNGLTCQGNIMARFGKDKSKVIVMGGLTYYEYEKFFSITKQQNHVQISMRSSDPIGKRVEAGAVYLPDERFFLNVTNPDAFDALEEYGLALRYSQKIDLNVYNFPTVCLWYASHYLYGGGPLINDTRGGIWEMDNVVKSGFLKYSPVAIRLVPDNYQPNNQQGWWDDEHWQMYGDNREFATIGPHYKVPYETSKKFAEAIIERGGIPIGYSQTARRSEDYCLKYPEHMLFNDSKRLIGKPEDQGKRWSNDFMWSYDFTDPGFIKHMQGVYANLKSAGFKGIMFDYPKRTGWAYEGGFEDIYSTTTSAYRNIFRLAYEGLGKDSYIDENMSGTDVTLGLIASQRIWNDCSIINPKMIAHGGLRWYKNRVVVNYDMDSKIPNQALPADNEDGYRSMFTMLYHTSGRVLLGSSFSKMNKGQLHALSRLYPFHSLPKSARPLDAFSGVKYPSVYDFEVNSKWHQLIFYNSAIDTSVTTEKDLLKGNIKYIPSLIGVDLSKNRASGGVGLDPVKEYYIYDFWNDKFIGKKAGNQRFVQLLRPNEARVMSVHEVENHPQFISTNRHIMQGFVDVSDYKWNNGKRQLSGKSLVTEGESYVIVIAANGYTYLRHNVSSGTSKIKHLSKELMELSIDVPKNETVEWMIDFSK